jgi:Rha family phage regulatory protein
MNDIILSTQNGEPVASSRDVAKRFGKRHDHVIRDIAEIVKSFPKNGDPPLFFKTEYVHPQNHQKYPMYLMNRDGFSLLAMTPSKMRRSIAGSILLLFLWQKIACAAYVRDE